MSGDRPFPAEQAGPFPTPPATFVDRAGRDVELLRFSDVDDQASLLASLADMYEAFDPADRAQGIPPTGRDRIESWLETLTETDAVNVVARHGGDVVGHATLVPDGAGAYELAIFVHQDYQGAGIGSRLIRHLLGAGAESGVERVWLTVERWNAPALVLYEDVGFERTSDDHFELEMSLRLS